MHLPGYDAWKTESGYRDMTPEEEKIDYLQDTIKKMEAALTECAAYFDQRSDISSEHDEDGSPRPNEAMKMLQMVEEALS